MRKSLLIWVILLLNISTTAKSQEGPKYIPGIIHLHSNVSTGIYSIKELAQLAQAKDVPIMVITDHLLLKAEYGLPPFRRIIKKKVEKNSILRFGVKDYLSQIEEIDKLYSSLLIIPGAEVTPFYFWKGNYFRKDLTLHNLHKQMLVIGLKKADDYLKMPVVGNYHFSLSKENLLRFWPIVLILLGLWMVKKRRKSKFRFRTQSFILSSHPYRRLGIVISILGLLLLFNNLPFLPYDQYHGDRGSQPYQDLIDDVNGRKGLTFWSAPEVGTSEKVSLIEISTLSYPEVLLQSKDYTGFASLYEGYREVGGPGGIWDRVLIEYCQGKRDKPVWTIGEIDYHGPFEKKEIDDVQTVFLLDRVDENSVIAALRKGKCYALWRTKEYQLVLNDFTLSVSGGKIRLMGDTLVTEELPRVNFALSSSDGKRRGVRVKLIRSGRVIREFVGLTPMKRKFYDYSLPEGEKSYYRLDVETEYPHKILTNPIFVRLK